ncbi:hypothetical protein CQA42_05175 [Helicobacter sp. MIT 99-5507]|nr:hypothetical protein CQA42_05175 [Helicobacter sp. MIT 99-5507]
MRVLILFLLFCNYINAAWVMFYDGEDTYIYNNVSGDIYIRHKKGGKNYEDVFIKMPSGVIPNNNINKKDINENNTLPQDILLDRLQNIQNDSK